LQEYAWRFGLVLLLGLAGCASGPAGPAWRELRPLGSDIQAYRPPPAASGAVSGPLKIEEPTGAVTLRKALSLALMSNPELAAFGWEVRAAEAREVQAGLLPNPEVEVEVEELAGEGERSGFDAAEMSLVLGQLIELGGKRAGRKKLAALSTAIGAWDYESKRLDVFTDTVRAFVKVLAAQRRLALSQDSLGLAEQVRQAVSERVKAGKVSPLEETKAGVELSIGRIKLEQAKRELDAARESLAAMWGSAAATFARAEGSFETIDEVPPPAQLMQHLERSPEIARWETELEQRRAALDLEKARRIPDLTVSGGVQRLNETNDRAFVLGLSVPLSLFNRNQGGISEARHNLLKAVEHRRAADVQVRTALARAHGVLSSSHLEASILKNDVLPAALQAFAASREGYRQGKFGYLQVLDAQRTLLDARAQYIDALARYHIALAGAERLIGRPLDVVSQPTEQSPEEAKDEE